MKTYTVVKEFRTLVQGLKKDAVVDETLEQELAFPLSIEVLKTKGFLAEIKAEETVPSQAPAAVPPAEFKPAETK